MKALICITTSNRSMAVKAFVWDYIAYCQQNPDYDFVLSLDGNDKETITYCRRHHIPIVYSAAQEGVGLSKNRILQTYTDYDHYFFIEDDVGLLDRQIFDQHIQAAKSLGIEHMSLFPAERIGEKVEEISLPTGETVIGCMFGSAQFNYFTKKGIEVVGGFHTCFAAYRRFGHTEHSYRFVNAGLAKYPFYVLKDCLQGSLAWNDPISVTKIKVDTINRVFKDEYNLIEQKLTNFPLKTLSPFSVPDSLDLSAAKKPASALFSSLLFSTNMMMLNVFRYLKRLVKQYAVK